MDIERFDKMNKIKSLSPEDNRFERAAQDLKQLARSGRSLSTSEFAAMLDKLGFRSETKGDRKWYYNPDGGKTYVTIYNNGLSPGFIRQRLRSLGILPGKEQKESHTTKATETSEEDQLSVLLSGDIGEIAKLAQTTKNHSIQSLLGQSISDPDFKDAILSLLRNPHLSSHVIDEMAVAFYGSQVFDMAISKRLKEAQRQN